MNAIKALKALSSSYIVVCLVFVVLSVCVEGENPLAVFWDMYDFPPIYPIGLLGIAILALFLPSQD